MNKDQVKGKWKKLSGEVQSKRGKLTNNASIRVAGETKKIAGVAQEQYGITKEEVDKQVKAWNDSLKN